MNEELRREVCRWVMNYNSSYSGIHPGIRQIYFGRGDFFDMSGDVFFIVSSYDPSLEEKISDIDIKIARTFPEDDYQFQLFPFGEERLKKEKLELIINSLINENDSEDTEKITDKRDPSYSKFID